MSKSWAVMSMIATFVLAWYLPANAQWIQASAPNQSRVHAFASLGSNFFCGITGIGDSAGGVFISTDSGATWSATALIRIPVYTLAVTDTYLFAGTNLGVYRTSDNGASWTAVNNGLVNLSIWVLAVSGKSIFAGSSGGGLFRSFDNGLIWSPAGIRGGYILSLAVSDTTLYVGGMGYVFRSKDNGETFTTLGITWADVTAITVVGDRLYAGTDREGVYIMPNDSTWIPAGLSDKPIWCLTASDTSIFAGSDSGVFRYTNRDTIWQVKNEGITDSAIWSLAVLGNSLTAGTFGNGIWRRPLSEVITSVHDIANNAPESYVLRQNYPNPFNPSTVIGYSLPCAGYVSLRVFNTLGEVVRTLVDGIQPAGEKSILFKAESLPSGVYFYRLQAGSFTDTKKLILIR